MTAKDRKRKWTDFLISGYDPRMLFDIQSLRTAALLENHPPGGCDAKGGGRGRAKREAEMVHHIGPPKESGKRI